MTDLGKIDRDAFESIVAPHLGAARDDVALGPTHERAGRLALDVVLADVAVSGIPPSHVTVSLTLPPAFTDEALAATWRGLAGYADELGVAVVAGHTARYAGIDTSWIGAATAMGIGDPEDVIRPDGARPGDALVVGTGPGAEVAGLFSHLFGDELDLPADDLEAARERLDDVETVGDALAAAGAGDVSAIHDATEGGLLGALAEMAEGAGAGFDVDRGAVPVRDGVAAVCDAVGVDPWTVTSAGTIVVAVAPGDADAVVEALAARGTPAAVVGTVVEGSGVRLDGEPVEPPSTDPSWAAFAELAGRGSDGG